MLMLLLPLSSIALALTSIWITWRSKQQREATNLPPYRSPGTISPPTDTLLPHGSKCPKCGKQPNMHEVYEPARNRIRQRCRRTGWWHPDTYRGCGAIWYERPLDAEPRS